MNKKRIIFLPEKSSIPNCLTLFRFLLSPITIIFAFLNIYISTSHNYSLFSFNLSSLTLQLTLFSCISLIFFALAAITDFLDGYLARKWAVISNFGKVYDPVADKVLIVGTLIALMAQGSLWLPLGILMIARDLIMDVVRISISKQQIIIAASTLAKWKTSTQMIVIMLILLFLNKKSTSWDANRIVSSCFMTIPVVLSLISFAQYVPLILRNLSMGKEPSKI